MGELKQIEAVKNIYRHIYYNRDEINAVNALEEYAAGVYGPTLYEKDIEIARLKAEVERERVRSDALKSNLDFEEKRRLATERSLNDAEAQLAELRARVRPGVEDIHNIADDFCEAMEASYGIPYDKVPALARAIHKAMGGEE